MIFRLFAVVLVGWLVAACTPDELGYGPKHLRPVSQEVRQKMSSLGMATTSPILVRIFKEESQLEVWKQTRTGRYALLNTFDICKWSGKLGPKKQEGDRQAPEGFYTIRPAQMNPNSSYHLSFNLGYPNAYDRAFGRTGSNLMVHGACSSRGCYAMEDKQIQDIYALARDAFRGGQRDFQVHAFPFRMTPENLARHVDDPSYDFWKMLKEGSDHFEVTKVPPKVDVCSKRYVFNATPENAGASFNARNSCPTYTIPNPIATAVAAKQRQDEEKVTQLVAQLEDQRKREEEWAKRKTAVAEIIKGNSDEENAGEGTAAAGEATAVAAATPASVGGVPVPRRSPRALALQQEQSSGTGKFFSSIFGGDKDKAAAGSAAAAETADTAPTPVKTVAVKPAAEKPAPEKPATEVTAKAEPAENAGEESSIAADDTAPEAEAKSSGSLLSRWFGSGN